MNVNEQTNLKVSVFESGVTLTMAEWQSMLNLVWG
jgi:hypothetical protein